MNRFQDLVVALASAIEDPCGKNEMAVAYALIVCGKACPPERRVEFVAFLQEVYVELRKGPDAQAQSVSLPSMRN